MGSADFYLYVNNIDNYDCSSLEIYLEIERATCRGETEVYIVVNETYHYGRSDDFPDRGLSFDGFCHFIVFGCYLQVTIRPTDLRYNGAQLTGVVNLPECFNNSNVTDPLTLNIQGLAT